MRVRCRLRVVSSLVMGGAIVALSSNCVLAQNITLDGSLGPAGTLTGPRYTIPQAAGQTVGSNLFHSFGKFNLDAGERADFYSAPGIRNILSRVTGGSRSLIDGLIYTDSSNVNLFLINPSGIIFGPNARIDVGSATRGSFVATTVDALVWPNGGQFSATNPGGSESLLTIVGDPSGFLSLQRPPQPIMSSGSSLEVYEGQSLLLLGGDVTLDGSFLSVDYTKGGRIELGGVAEPGTVGLSVNGNDLSLNFSDSVARADVFVTNGAVIDVRAGDGGSIAINARNLNISGGSVLATGIGANLGSIGSQAGDITLNATGTITIANSGVLNLVEPGGVGNGGNININARLLSITDAAQLAASTYGRGNSGSIFLQADSSVSLGRNTAIFNKVEAGGVGNGGDINITAGSLSLTDGAQLQTFVGYDRDRILPAGRGDVGDVNINVRDSVTLVGKGIDSGTTITAIWSGVSVRAVGNGGDINIRARSLSLTNAQLGADTNGKGDAGNIFIRVADSIYLTNSDFVLDGTRRSRIGSAMTSTGSVGNGGDIDIQARSLFLDNGAVLDARTQGNGNAGNIKVSANTLTATNGGQISTTSQSSGRAGTISLDVTDSVTLSGSDPNFAQRKTQSRTAILIPDSPASGVFARTEGAGAAGDLQITTGQLIVRDGARVTVTSTGSGIAGSSIVKADSIRLDKEGKISADTSGGGGNINLYTGHLILRRGSSISTNATGSNIPGGNITIDTDNLVAIPKEDSDITANAENSFGGRVIVNAQGIFGTEFRPQDTPLSDITASSALGPQFNGLVELNTPGIDPGRGLANLPTELIDASNQIAQTCGAGRGEAGKNEFIVTGRRGIPSNPYEPLSNDQALEDIHPPSGFSSRRNSNLDAAKAVTSQSVTSDPKQPIVEAQGWVMNDKGQVVLTATASIATPHNSLPASATCPSS